MAFFKTPDGVELFYKDWGSGKPVVFIHGWPLNADMWEYQMVPMARKGLRTIAYDRRGFGRSDQPGGVYDYDVLADDLHALIETLDLHDVTLVGFSMGGGEVARYLSRHGSARIARMVLLSAVTPFLVKTPDNPDGVDRNIFDQMVEQLSQDRPHFLAGLGKKLYGAGLLNFSVSSELLQWTGTLALQGSPLATIDCVRLFSETDFRADMRAFDKPTLVIHGTSDTTVPSEASGQRSVAAIPGSRFIEYDGAPHGLFYTEHARVTADLLAFIGA
ncbi:alpha/beta fold hydrolase [Lichenicola sp.]|uniref:alpha/beta fold hydrolase n=1 Tax=Lichenicola sp. TaxID=2804529 RepID=UPI003B008785